MKLLRKLAEEATPLGIQEIISMTKPDTTYQVVDRTWVIWLRRLIVGFILLIGLPLAVYSLFIAFQ